MVALQQLGLLSKKIIMTDREMLYLEKLINDFMKSCDVSLDEVIGTLYKWKAYREKPRTISKGKKEELW